MKGDINDTLLEEGDDAVRARSDATCRYEPASPSTREETFVLRKLDEVEPEGIQWIWDGYLARGKVTLLCGDPGLGKSQLALDLAARVTIGSHFPNGPRAPQSSVLLLTSEDGLADTVAPRLIAAGADLSRISTLDHNAVGQDRFSLKVHLAELAQMIDQVGDVQLVVIDALSSYLGDIDANSQNDVRNVIDPLSQLAEDKGVAILGVCHPPKGKQINSVHSVSGSLSIAAAARAIFIVTKEPESDRRLLLCAKSNLAVMPSGRGFSVITEPLPGKAITAPRVLWDDAPVDLSADQALAAQAETSRGGYALQEAKTFLEDFLGNGPRFTIEVKEAAKDHLIAWRTVERAKTGLKIETKKDPGDLKGRWKWALPS